MNQIKQRPLAAPPRRRSWLDILLLQPLSTNAQAALVLVRRGRVFSIIPAGSTRVISDYIDWPCEIIEVDARERQLNMQLSLESCDSGRYFQASLQLVYLVVRPERVALEIDDVLSELEQTIGAATQITARSLTIDRPGLLKESILELLEYGGSLNTRIASLGLTLRRADITIDIAVADREFAERLYELHRARPFACRILAESLDPRVNFDIQFAGSYRNRSRTRLNHTADEAEFSIREMSAKSIRRVAIEFAPHEYREAAHAIAEALRSNPILSAELAAAELELIQPVVDIHPGRPMLAAAMQARLLPAPVADSNDPFERMLPMLNPYLPITPAPDEAHLAPVITPLITPEAPESEQAESTMRVQQDDDLWHDDPMEDDPMESDQTDTHQSAAEVFDEAVTSGWQVDPSLFLGSPANEPVLPGWLQSWNPEHNEETTEPDVETADDDLADQDPSYGADDDRTDYDLPAETERDWAQAETIGAAQLSSEIEPAAPPADPSAALIPPSFPSAALIRGSAAPDMDGQIRRWIQLLRSDGDEEFERLALVIIEHPDQLATVLSGLIRDPAFLQSATNSIYQQRLANELADYVKLPPPPVWLAEAPTETSDLPGQTDQQSLPEWLRIG